MVNNGALTQKPQVYKSNTPYIRYSVAKNVKNANKLTGSIGSLQKQIQSVPSLVDRYQDDHLTPQGDLPAAGAMTDEERI